MDIRHIQSIGRLEILARNKMLEKQMTINVRRNGKEFKAAKAYALANPAECKAFSLSNNFSGQPCEFMLERHFESGRLTKSNNGYCLHIHSNLWFDFPAAQA